MSVTDGTALLQTALQKLREGRVDEAIVDMESALASEPRSPLLHAYLGVAYGQKGDNAQAISHLKESLALGETPKTHYNLAVIYEKAGQFKEAYAHGTSALRLDRGYAQASQLVDRVKPKLSVAASGTEATAQFTNAPAPTPPEPWQGATGEAPGDRSRAEQIAIDKSLQRALAEHRIKEHHRSQMRNAVLYGAICGPFVVIPMNFMLSVFGLGWFPKLAMGGFGFALYLLLMAVAGSLYGSAIALWMGYTSGGEGAGVQAGVGLGAIMGFILGILTGHIVVALVVAVIYAGIGFGAGTLVGRLVYASTDMN